MMSLNHYGKVSYKCMQAYASIAFVVIVYALITKSLGMTKAIIVRGHGNLCRTSKTISSS